MSKRYLLIVNIVIGFILTLAIYALSGGNPWNRVGYAVFISVVPGIVTLVVVSLFVRAGSWKAVTVIYWLSFGLVVASQGLLRMI